MIAILEADVVDKNILGVRGYTSLDSDQPNCHHAVIETDLLLVPLSDVILIIIAQRSHE